MLKNLKFRTVVTVIFHAFFLYIVTAHPKNYDAGYGWFIGMDVTLFVTTFFTTWLNAIVKKRYAVDTGEMMALGEAILLSWVLRIVCVIGVILTLVFAKQHNPFLWWGVFAYLLAISYGWIFGKFFSRPTVASHKTVPQVQSSVLLAVITLAVLGTNAQSVLAGEVIKDTSKTAQVFEGQWVFVPSDSKSSESLIVLMPGTLDFLEDSPKSIIMIINGNFLTDDEIASEMQESIVQSRCHNISQFIIHYGEWTIAICSSEELLFNRPITTGEICIVKIDGNKFCGSIVSGSVNVTTVFEGLSIFFGNLKVQWHAKL